MPVCHLEKGQYDVAIEYFKQGPVLKRKLDEDAILAKYWLGIAYLKAGDKRRAKTQLAAVYAENPGYEEIKKYAIEAGAI